MVFNSKKQIDAMPTDTKLHKLKPNNTLYQVNDRDGLYAAVTPADSTRRLLRLLPAVPLAGCSGAPSLTVAGAYFPTWIACALIAVAVAALARWVMVKTGLALLIPFQLAVNLALGVLVGLGLWLAWGGA